MKKKRFTMIPAVFIIFEKDNKIALLRRFNTGHEDGNYTVAAGHVDGKEPMRVAAARESFEEMGAQVYVDDLEFVHLLHSAALELDGAEYICAFFKCQKWEGEITNMEPEKSDELIWVDKNNLPENMIPYIRQAIELANDGVKYSEYEF